MPRVKKQKRKFASQEERDAFILSHGKFGTYIAKRNSACVGVRGFEFEDLLQAAWVRITQLADYYDPSFNVKFGTYAANRINQAVVRAAVDQCNAIAVGDRHFTEKGKKTHMPETRAAVEAAKQVRTVSLVRDPAIAGSCKEPHEIASDREQSALLYKALSRLPQCERFVLMKMFGIGCEAQTQVAIAADMQMTKQNVGHIKNRALSRLKKILVHTMGDEL